MISFYTASLLCPGKTHKGHWVLLSSAKSIIQKAEGEHEIRLG